MPNSKIRDTAELIKQQYLVQCQKDLWAHGFVTGNPSISEVLLEILRNL